MIQKAFKNLILKKALHLKLKYNSCAKKNNFCFKNKINSSVDYFSINNLLFEIAWQAPSMTTENNNKIINELN